MLQEIKISDYLTRYGENWADSLPDNCPPEDVKISEGDLFFRFTKNEDSIIDDDWKSYLLLYPEREYYGENLVNAAGLSMLDDLDDAKNQLRLPYIKKQFKGLAQISIIPEDGVVKHTGDKIHHYTWWRTEKCNLSKAQMVCD